MNQTKTTTRAVNGGIEGVRIATEPSVTAKAITAFAFSDMAVRPCGHGLPPVLPWRQENWTLVEILKSDLRRYSIIDREVLRTLAVLDAACIPYDHIYVGHEDKKPFKVPQKVINAVSRAVPALAGATVALVTFLVAAAMFTAGIAVALISDPVVIVAIKEMDGTYQLLEIGKWYS
jgi:hypothetical protein